MTGLAVAAVSVTVTGVVQAEETVPTDIRANVVSLETVAEPAVTQAQVKEAKASFDQARQDFVAQEAVVKEIESVKDQAQIAVVEASLAVTEIQRLSDQANSETIAQAQEAVTEASYDVVAAQESFEKEQDRAKAAALDVLVQEGQVKKDQAKVDDAEAAVKGAQEVVEVVRGSIDKNSVQPKLTEAESELADKTNKVKGAQTGLEEAKKSDANLIESWRQAEEVVIQKSLAVEETENLLNQVVNEMAKEQVSTSFEDHTYYNQRDAIWASYYGNGSFAATGCVPAVLAMVFTELERRGVTPKQVADYLYNNTDYFNKNFSGTSAHGIVSASRHFGFVPTQLASQSAIIEALQAGHHVVGAVQNNKFSPWGPGYSHEVVMRGYSNGNTYIYDPYNRANIGWYPVASLWAEQSQDRDDRALGAPFFKITTQKMAQLEASRTRATEANQAANQQLVEAKQAMSVLQARSLQVPEAQAALEQANTELNLARTKVLQAQEAVRLASQDRIQKEARLIEAKADLAQKEESLNEAKKVLTVSQVKLDALRTTQTEADQVSIQAAQRLTQAKQTLVDKEAMLLELEQASERLTEAQENLVAAKLDLAHKTQLSEEAQAKLEVLKTVVSEAQSNYTRLLSTYQANLDKEQQVQLKNDYQSITLSGGQVVSVVDETGKVTAYIEGNYMNKAKAYSQVGNLSNVESENTQLEEKTNSVLPSTGESDSYLVLVGVSLMSLLGLVGLKRKV